MNKKALRRELELILEKAIQEVLNKRNTDAAKKIRKATHAASKIVAKKFLKTLKTTDENKVPSPPKAVEKPVVILKKTTEKQAALHKKAIPQKVKKSIAKVKKK